LYIYREDDDDAVDAFHQTVQDLFEEEEDLLNMHMSVIQENAELLTEEVLADSLLSVERLVIVSVVT
jgi:hypothetical protein